MGFCVTEIIKKDALCDFSFQTWQALKQNTLDDPESSVSGVCHQSWCCFVLIRAQPHECDSSQKKYKVLHMTRDFYHSLTTCSASGALFLVTNSQMIGYVCWILLIVKLVVMQRSCTGTWCTAGHSNELDLLLSVISLHYVLASVPNCPRPQGCRQCEVHKLCM